MHAIKRSLYFFVALAIMDFFFASCHHHRSKSSLPYISYDTIGSFSFMDQDGNVVTNNTVRGKVCVVYFFHIGCKDITPGVHAHMLQLYKIFEYDTGVVFLSYTIYPQADSVPALKAYSAQYHVRADKWHFLTGKLSDLCSMQQDSYKLVRNEDTAGIGVVHTPYCVLVDRDGRLRGYYKGTEQGQMDSMAVHIEVLRNRY